MQDYPSLWDGAIPDIVNSPDKTNDHPTALRTAIWFWINYSIYKVADKEDSERNVANVTRVVNGKDMGLIERQQGYRLANTVF